MAEYLSKANKQFTMGAVFLLCVHVANSQTLNDPTRPPTATETRQDQGKGGESGLVLQSVLIGPARKVAIINGQTIRLGEKIGDSRLVKITESQVVLRNGKDMQTLKLFPEVEKRPVSGRSEAGAKVEGR